MAHENNAGMGYLGKIPLRPVPFGSLSIHDLSSPNNEMIHYYSLKPLCRVG
jgi:hypothetical protein